MNTDLIEKKILLKAPIDRVWRALSDSVEFGTWFGMRFNGPFSPGAPVTGVIMPTTVDAEVGAKQKPHEGMPFEIIVENIQPKTLFSFRWHPFAIDPAIDYSAEPTTLVSFMLEEVTEGVMLSVTESGFDRIPLERRAKAFAANDGGWSKVITVLDRYVTQCAPAQA